MKKRVHVILSLALSIVFLMSMCSTALAEHCKWGNEGSCNVIWWVDGNTKMHARACKNHVEDKEHDNYVLVTGWEKCTPDEGGECTTCGWDYIRDVNTEEYNEAYMLEKFMRAANSGEERKAPIEFEIDGNKIKIRFSDYYFMVLAELGIYPSESMSVDTEYTMILTGGKKHAYTGSAIKPAILTRTSEYGPMDWLLKHDLIKIDNITYVNNVNPGTATANVTFKVKDSISKTLSVDFTIVGEGGNEGGGNQPGGGTEEEKKELIEAALPDGGSIKIEGIFTGAEPAPKADPVPVDDTGHENLNKILEKEENVIIVYEVGLGEGVEINGSAEITLPVSGYEGWKVLVLHGLDNGDVEQQESYVKNGEVTIKISSCSPFAFIPIEAPAAETDALPQTGDSSSLMLWLGMMLASGAALMGLRRKASQR